MFEDLDICDGSMLNLFDTASHAKPYIALIIIQG
jgi:hypothetical protein